jgi:ferrous iron transport protein B
MAGSEAPVRDARATLRVAVLGNPNAGKSTLFNALTGLSQRVGNYPGVTVEKKVGAVATDAGSVDLVDLPGTYSLAAHSPDEMVAVDLLLGHVAREPRPDAVLAVVDASNLERNLYLVSQLLDTKLPLVVALNMVDVAEARGVHVDADRLSERLGVPVVPTRADRRAGVDRLRAELASVASARRRPAPAVAFALPPPLAAGVEHLRRELVPEWSRAVGRSVHESELLRVLVDEGGHAEARLRASLPTAEPTLARARATARGDVPLSAVEAQCRYRWIRQVVTGCVRREAPRSANWTDRIDRVLTHRVLGVVVFAAAMLLLFQSIFTWAVPVMDAIQGLFARLGSLVGSAMSDGALKSLVVDGVIAGVGSVVVFLPQILLLFLFLGILEDCGYMARAAFLMDKLMSRVGLSGKSFIPMLSGFACAVPAVMATRVIEHRRDRLATILVTPLMTCSARLPVYAVLIAAFVPRRRVLFGAISLPAATLLGLYVLGVVTAIALAFVFKRTLLRGPTPPFVLELPTYKWPSPRMLAQRLLERGSAFLTRAGTVILAMSLVVWALAWFPRSHETERRFETERAAVVATHAAGADAQLAALDARESAELLEQSALGRTGRTVEPLFRPLGWDWRVTMAAIAAFPAREVVVSTLGTIFSLGRDVDEGSADLQRALQRATRPDGSPLFTLPVALSVMVFFALCCQCSATIATIRRETNSWGWAWFTFGYMTVLAYLGGFATFQLASRLLPGAGA